MSEHRLHGSWLLSCLSLLGCSSETGSDGGTATTECPLEAPARAQAELLPQQAIGELAWISSQTHGAGAGASRAFGFGVPFTTSGALAVASVLEACTAEKRFDEFCSGGDEQNPGPRHCSQMECTGAGELVVNTRLDALPIEVDAEPPPGVVEIRQARQSATFTEEDAGGVALEWTTEFDVTPPGSEPLGIAHEGAGTATDDGATVASELTVDGFASSEAPFVLRLEWSADGPSGSGSVGAREVLELTEGNPAWLGNCAD